MCWATGLSPTEDPLSLYWTHSELPQVGSAEVLSTGPFPLLGSVLEACTPMLPACSTHHPVTAGDGRTVGGLWWAIDEACFQH